MRLVFTTWAWPTHLYALVPFAWACRAAGHDVVFASQPALLDEIVGAGLPAAAVGSDVDTVGIVREYLRPSRVEGPPRAVRMLMAHAESMVDDLTALVRDWRADVVVHDQTALAGPLAAAAGKVPAVRHLYGADLMSRVAPQLAEVFAPLAERLGAQGFDPCGDLTVDPVPPSVQGPATQRRLSVRYVPYSGATVLPVDLPDARERPRVCVTWGHTIAKVDAERFPVGRIADAAAELDVEVVVAVSANQRALLGPLPESVRVLVDQPLEEILARCDLLVGHGGAAGILTALRAGLPMLLVPQLPDHAGHSARVAARGAGTVLGVEELPGVKERIERLLPDSSVERREARAVAEEMRAQPAPASAVTSLTALLGDRAGAERIL
ncbi:nucleotide disphospho-sugar-binding domain-containing protein [Amycolatopsis circi]|uniref:nucleotide disphospho-sugar-binding domain-containing protein n=1 Tax=Amycolatopsis circi TaxID=871959 RepID=UPI000E25BADE|nr:nucleotide disphospho-sugar-binding domain-containing protein [Amycolatopsis circi]